MWRTLKKGFPKLVEKIICIMDNRTDLDRLIKKQAVMAKLKGFFEIGEGRLEK